MKKEISQQTKVKSVFTFILLKLLEIGSLFGLTFGIYYLGKFAQTIGLEASGFAWFDGLVFMLLIFLVVLGLGLGVYLIALLFIWIVKLNWKWALMLNETPEEKLIRESNKAEKELKKLEKKKQECIEEYGFWVGDEVKIVTPDDVHTKYKNEIRKVSRVGWLYFGLEGIKEANFSSCELKPIKDRRKKDERNNKRTLE